MNRFANDGSFLQQFKPKQAECNSASAGLPHATANSSTNSTAGVALIKPASKASCKSSGKRITAKAAFGADDDEEDEILIQPAKKHATIEQKPAPRTPAASLPVKSVAVEQPRQSTIVELDAGRQKHLSWHTESTSVSQSMQQPAAAVYAETKNCLIARRDVPSAPSIKMYSADTFHPSSTTAVDSRYDDRGRKRKTRTKSNNKLEYDSDEEIDSSTGYTWEHKLRMEEMKRTAEQATPRQFRHIGDYLPPEVMQKLTPRPSAGQQNSTTAVADTLVTSMANVAAENKLNESNVGFKLLAKMGWKDGSGLGASSQGRQEPIAAAGDAAKTKVGLGMKTAEEEEGEDKDEFDLYRRRMMTAYKYRPNPLNNPRRPYY